MYLDLRKVSIYGGTNEVQKNLIANCRRSDSHGLHLHRRAADARRHGRAVSCETEYDFEARRKRLEASRRQAPGYSPALWSQLADLGLFALNVPEAYGGIGAGPVETMIVMEGLGRGLVLEPFVTTGVIAARLIATHGTVAQKERLPRRDRRRSTASGSGRARTRVALRPGRGLDHGASRRRRLDPAKAPSRSCCMATARIA